MGSRLKGAKKITLKSTNLNVVFVNSEAATSEKIVFFSPQKKGKAVVTAKVTTSSGTKTYKFRIGVKTDPPAASSSKKTTKKTVKKYTVTFKPNKGTVSKKSKKVEKNGKYGSLPTPKRNYYSFTGWYTKSSGGKKVTSKTKIVKNANHKLYAHWKAKKYTVTYKLNGGTNNSKNKKHFTVETSKFSLYSPKRSGYDFGGWYKDSAFKTKITQIKKGTHSSITVYARWIKRLLVDYDITNVKEADVNKVFTALKSGVISAEKVNDTWNYKFTKGNNAVLIPVTFFYDESDSDNPIWFNDKMKNTLNTGYNSADGNSGDSANFLVRNLGFTYFPEGSNNIYTQCYYQNFYKLNGQLTKNKNNFDLQCTLVDQVSFRCYDANDFGNKPTSAKDYVSLLRRIGSSYKDSVIPRFKVTMNDPSKYNGELYFGAYSVSGIGHKQSDNVSDLIDVGVSSIKIVTSLPSMSYKTFYDIYKVMNTLTNTGSNAYECSGLKNLLSQQGNYCYAYKFKSPLSLVNQNDKIQLSVEASLESLQYPFTGFKGTDTDIEFSFDFD